MKYFGSCRSRSAWLALVAFLTLSSVLLQTGCGGALGASPSAPPSPTPGPPPPPPPASFSISGTISAGTGASVTLSGTASSSTTADSSGNYSFTGLAAGSYTVTPTEAGFSISPASQSVAITNANMSGVDFSATAPSSAGIEVVNHIIFMAEENRGFDHYFGKLNDYRRNLGLSADVNGLPDNCSSSNSDWTVKCDAMNLSPNGSGVPTMPIYAFHLKTMCIDGLSPDWISGHWDFNAEAPTSNTPLMDGFVISAASAAIANGEADTAGIRAMGFYTGDDLPYHYWLATQFGTSDEWFNPAPTRTQPNRFYMMGATSGGYAYPTPGAVINAKTIFDLLQAAGVSWKIYTEIDDKYTYASVFSGFMSRYGSTGNIVQDDGFVQFMADAQSGNLPSVVFLEKPDADEKPGTGNIQTGVAETRALINAVMYDQNGGPGKSWKDSVIIFTFDEGGGTYDHVAPPVNVPSPDGIQPLDVCTSASDPRCPLAVQTHAAPPYDPPGTDFNRYGFRVPLMVISPFTTPHYVSHTVTDYTAWLKFVEKRFNLPSLNLRDAAASDMTEYFNFQNPPWATPPANPPTDSTGVCSSTLP